MADELASQGQAEEEDLGLARDAAAFYLKLSESVLRQAPGHPALAEAVAGGFTQYAYAFDAERLEATVVRAALRQRQRAVRLYERAHRHAMAALELQQPGLAAALAAPARPNASASASASAGAAPLRLAPQQVGAGVLGRGVEGGCPPASRR